MCYADLPFLPQLKMTADRKFQGIFCSSWMVLTAGEDSDLLCDLKHCLLFHIKISVPAGCSPLLQRHGLFFRFP